MLIYPYSPASQSSKDLANAIGIKRAKHEGKAIKTDLLINWGASSIAREYNGEILNKPQAVAKAVNKLSSFKALDGHCTLPGFTESLEEANKWLAEGATVVARTKLTAHSGEGIVIVDPDSGDKLPEAKLYTRYVPKSEEYRLHVFKDEVFFVQRKARNKDIPDDKVNWKVRNHGNGFVFANKDIVFDNRKAAHAEAIQAVAALGLDFGAVDLIYNKRHGKYYVLEVNTACGLSGSTLDAYAKVFKDLV